MRFQQSLLSSLPSPLQISQVLIMGGFFARKIKDIDRDLQKFDVFVTKIPEMVSTNIESLTPWVPAKT